MDLQRLKANLGLRLFAWRYIPLIGFCGPVIERMDERALRIRMPLGWRTRNHLGSMYFGALATGADLVGGLLVMEKGRARGKKVHFAFKDVQGDFLKRPEGDVQFDCAAGAAIDAMIDDSLASGQRINRSIEVVATCPSLSGDEPVARFTLTLSIKAS
jgi:acyl-coenzyme A thioesterase PaaI-like protein